MTLGTTPTYVTHDYTQSHMTAHVQQHATQQFSDKLQVLKSYYIITVINTWSNIGKIQQRVYLEVQCSRNIHPVKAPPHDTIPSYGGSRLSHIRVNRQVWLVARVSRIRDPRVKLIRTRSIFEPSLSHEQCDYPIRGQQT